MTDTLRTAVLLTAIQLILVCNADTAMLGHEAQVNEQCMEIDRSLPWGSGVLAVQDDTCVAKIDDLQRSLPKLVEAHNLTAEYAEHHLKLNNLTSTFEATMEQLYAEFIRGGRALLSDQFEAIQIAQQHEKQYAESLEMLLSKLAVSERRTHEVMDKLADAEQNLRTSESRVEEQAAIIAQQQETIRSLRHQTVAIRRQNLRPETLPLQCCGRRCRYILAQTIEKSMIFLLILCFVVIMLLLLSMLALHYVAAEWMFEERDGVWQHFHPAEASGVEEFYLQWKHGRLSTDSIVLQRDTFSYVIDFKCNLQTNQRTGTIRRLKRNHCIVTVLVLIERVQSFLCAAVRRAKGRPLKLMIQFLNPSLCIVPALHSEEPSGSSSLGVWQWQADDGLFQDFEPHVSQAIDDRFKDWDTGEFRELYATSEGRHIHIWGNSRQSLRQTVVGGSGWWRHLRWHVPYTVSIHEPTWTPQNSEAEIVCVNPGSADYAKVVKLAFGVGQESLRHRCALVQVQRVQNIYLKRLYATERDNIIAVRGAENLNEKMMFHGTGPSSADFIARTKEGLMLEYANAGFYGRGLYFAHDPRYSANPKYACPLPGGQGLQILICSVLCGNVRHMGPEIDRDMSRRRLPAEQYDSVQGGPHRPLSTGPGEDASLMTVVYKESQVYPEFIITFRPLRDGEVSRDPAAPVEAG